MQNRLVTLLNQFSNFRKFVISLKNIASAKSNFLSPDSFAASWLIGVRAAPRLFANTSSQDIESLARKRPRQTQDAIAAADMVLKHEFNMLGSGPYRPIDPSRKASDGYLPIDWSFDPVSGLRFPSKIHYKDWDLWKMRPGLADIKLPWELARCQHWPALAQAWLLTGDRRYADEIFAQREDFDEANPVGFGIHWTCTMDVAIRAANWAVALEMVRSHVVAESVWLSAYRSLFIHGRFIRSNLENNYEVTSNHFLSNVVGLFYLARVFNESLEANEWEKFSRNAIEREIDIQILPDGADFESSIPYHRLVTELFLGAVSVANFSGQTFSQSLRNKLKIMVEFLLGVVRPDGLMPQLGDADDGRLHIFSGYGSWKPQDGRHIFSSAAQVLDVSEWGSYGGDQGYWEEFWWGGNLNDEKISHQIPDSERHFSDAGIAIHRSFMAYLVITNGIVGTQGFGNHKHNDLLSFEFHSFGVPLIVDPGSYVYTSDPAARNIFRGTSYHNTLMIDSVEQNELNPEWIFRLFEKSSPETLEYRTGDESFFYKGRHIGYTRLDQPIKHERSFELLKHNGELVVTDFLEGEGIHNLCWHFHLAPGVESIFDAKGINLCHDLLNMRWQLEIPEGLRMTCMPAWYSPSYGVRVPCQAIKLETDADIVGQNSWCFRVRKVDQ